MKFLFFLLVTGVSLLPSKCNREKAGEPCYKGRLEIKGICSNYTLALLEGALDTARIVASWTDENTGKAYSNVFALESPCSFPDSIQAGDTFYFTLDTARQDCAVCQAWYPRPPKSLAIRVLDKACR